MMSKQRGFDALLEKETDALRTLTKAIKSTDADSDNYKRLLPKLEAQKKKVKLMVEQSKVLGDWTFSEQTDYLPKEESWLQEFKVPLLALGIIACILYR